MGRRSKVVGTLFGMILMLGLIVAPATATHEGQPENPDSNDAQSWQDWLHDGSECEKVSEQSADWYTLGDPEEDYEWSLIVVNAGQPGDMRSDVTHDPEPGDYRNSQTEDVSNVILCWREIQEEFVLMLVKEWSEEGDGEAPTTFSLGDEGEEQAWDGTPISVEDGEEIRITEDVDLSELDEGCDYEADEEMPFTYVVDTDQAEDGLLTFTLTNTLDCPTEASSVVVLDDEQIRTQDQTPEETVEVLGEEEVRPSGVPAGTGGHLPATGAQGLLLLLLTGLGLTLGGITLRRMSAE